MKVNEKAFIPDEECVYHPYHSLVVSDAVFMVVKDFQYFIAVEKFSGEIGSEILADNAVKFIFPQPFADRDRKSLFRAC